MRIVLLIASPALFLLATAAPAATFTETKLTASDGATSDVFGSSVAISGNIAIVGAVGNRDAGINSGSAYLFDVTTGTQIAKLTASDGATSDSFGNSVAISGNIAIVGAQYNDSAGNNSGSAYLFDVTTGTQIAKLTASDATRDDYFGRSVAISGSTAIVGAFGNDDAGEHSGSAYLFDVITGSQIAKLTASDAGLGDAFGISVAISGSTAIVGAHNKGPRFRGTAYLFDVTTGAENAKLAASDGALHDAFGISVAISGSTAIVGAPADDDAGDNSGSAYLYPSDTVSTVPLPAGIWFLGSALGLIALRRFRRTRIA